MKLRETLDQFRSDDLKKYVYLLGGDSSVTRKADRVEFIASAMLNPASLKFVWSQMDEISQRAVSTAYHSSGEFNSAAFVAQYGSLPPRPQKENQLYRYSYYKEPILFDLFVILNRIADDMMPLLADLILEQEAFKLEGMEEVPTEAEFLDRVEEVVVAETEIAGRTDLLTYLQLMDQGQLRFSAKSNRLTAGSVRKVLANLVDEDFRELSDKVSGRNTIRPTGLDVFSQESGLATRTGKLTKAGRTYLQTQDADILLTAFEKWTGGNKVDEIHRTGLGGLKSRGTRLTPVAERREKVIEALSWCPVNRWIEIDKFYDALVVWDFDFELEKTDYSRLYIGSRYYGDLNGTGNYWGLTTGLYINAIIWETLASIGSVDIAFLVEDFLSPMAIRAHEDEPISQYDGLTHFRITPLGAFLLGQADAYLPLQPQHQKLFVINSDRVVHLAASLSPGERLQLETMADPIDEQCYQLDEEKLLSAVENGQDFDALFDFLRSGQDGELPQTIQDWLFGLRIKLDAFKELDTAVLIELKQADLMTLVQDDKTLSKLCQPVEKRTVLVRSIHQARFRKRLKKLGYLLR